MARPEMLSAELTCSVRKSVELISMVLQCVNDEVVVPRWTWGSLDTTIDVA